MLLIESNRWKRRCLSEYIVCAPAETSKQYVPLRAAGNTQICIQWAIYRWSLVRICGERNSVSQTYVASGKATYGAYLYVPRSYSHVGCHRNCVHTNAVSCYIGSHAYAVLYSDSILKHINSASRSTKGNDRTDRTCNFSFFRRW